MSLKAGDCEEYFNDGSVLKLTKQTCLGFFMINEFHGRKDASTAQQVWVAWLTEISYLFKNSLRLDKGFKDLHPIDIDPCQGTW